MKTSTLRAAIYARKSTDDNDKTDVNKSITRQIDRARAYAKTKGWEVVSTFEDDGISGAEYVNRPGFAQAMARQHEYDVLVTSESSRIGRDLTRNAAFVLDLIENGKRIYYYLTDEEERADTPEQKVMVTLRGYASEVERLKAGQRSFDALERKAQHGYNTGGVVYGYDNVQMYPDGDETKPKSHTDYKINATQADVIQRICRMHIAGYGHVTIAKTLNGDPRYAELSKSYFAGKRPAPPRKGTGSWAPSSVHKILRNERYTGIVPFGGFQKVYKRGAKARVRRAEKDVLRIARPDLRIVPENLWAAVQERVEAGKTTYLRESNGRPWHRRGAGVESRYLLTGLAECGCCGHNLTMIGGRPPYLYYGCAYRQTRGETVCENDLRARMAEADNLVIEQIRGVLTPAAVDYTIERALKLYAKQARAEEQRKTNTPEQLEAEVRRLRKELGRFMALIAGGTAPPSVMVEIQRREARLAEIETERRGVQGVEDREPSELDLRRLRKAFRDRLANLNGLLKSDIAAARQALRKVLAGRINFQPVERDGARGYDLRWNIVTGALLGGSYISMASPGGFEPPYSP